MSVPHHFESGSVASSAEVNENFDYVTDMLGADSTPDRLSPGGSVSVGDSDNTLLSAATHDYFVVSWNAEEYLSGSTRKFRRFEENNPATYLQVGKTGFEINTTSATAGDLNGQLQTALAVRANKNAPDYVYLDPAWHMQRRDRVPQSQEDYRLTYVPLLEPITIYENKQQWGVGTTTRNAYKWVPSEAVMVRFMVDITAWTNSGARLKVMQARKQRHVKYGMAVHAYGGDAANFGRSIGTGDVPLGTGAYLGQFVEERTAGFETSSIYIQGYWI